MRSESTDAEKKLWFFLRGRKLGGYKFRRQPVVAGFVADFYCAELKLVVELDGGQHLDPECKEYDQGRTEALAKLGIYVMRFSDIDALKNPDGVRRAIYDYACNCSTQAPSP